MDELQTTMTIYRVWGSHLGSSQLFKQHLESRRRITEFVEKVQVRKVSTYIPLFESIGVLWILALAIVAITAKPYIVKKKIFQ